MRPVEPSRHAVSRPAPVTTVAASCLWLVAFLGHLNPFGLFGFPGAPSAPSDLLGALLPGKRYGFVPAVTDAGGLVAGAGGGGAAALPRATAATSPIMGGIIEQAAPILVASACSAPAFLASTLAKMKLNTFGIVTSDGPGNQLLLATAERHRHGEHHHAVVVASEHPAS